MQLHQTPVVVIGCGVAGLSAAYQLADAGYLVTILAKEFPGENNIMYTSDWAGASLGFAAGGSFRARRVSQETFQTFWDISSRYAPEECGICRITQETYFDKKPDPSLIWYSKEAPDFRILSPSEYPAQYAFAVSYTSMTLEPPRYLPWLVKQVQSKGVKIMRVEVDSLRAALDHIPDAKAIINCSGIGSRYLKDVKDDAVFPERGQTCAIRTSFKKLIIRSGAEYTYLIPRPLSGLLILGGINEPFNTSPEPNPASREMFKQRAHKICPELGPVDQMEFVMDIVGVRSTRKGGYRLERQEGGKLPIVHSYGYNGGGYQASMGAGKEVVRLLRGEDSY
ncbi:nucleotide-binding domain-containing protein [Dacryopinax primogenitus]|uniref:Nucleotide-binding domain-containing protein n=1 Tax=Dacryopinax primogenitus (strain DJM 731) TaxID=1858805 RepID=M5G4S4_DACPD|nr:nucleotide-binding domain-containing protein [Dacryopinax primogenitus]EJU00862.1 nucleotide-binding domain-containing protein [Dacryopinax primogenitus]